MTRLRLPPSVALPLMALTGASALAVAAAVRLSLPGGLPHEPAGEPSPVSVATLPTFDSTGVPDYPLIEADPFDPERRPPDLSGWSSVVAGATDSVVGPQPLQLIGTAVLPQGRGFAMCQVGAEPARLVRIGETVAGYTLRSVAQGRATFHTPGGDQIEVRVIRTGS